jgi:hypothetical protein
VLPGRASDIEAENKWAILPQPSPHTNLTPYTMTAYSGDVGQDHRRDPKIKEHGAGCAFDADGHFCTSQTPVRASDNGPGQGTKDAKGGGPNGT